MKTWIARLGLLLVGLPVLSQPALAQPESASLELMGHLGRGTFTPLLRRGLHARNPRGDYSST